LSSDSLTSLIDFSERPLPQGPSENAPNWPEHAAKQRAADDVVIIAPEFHDIASPALKNFLLYATKAELAHKRGLLVVSRRARGRLPHQRATLPATRTAACATCRGHLIVRYVNQVLNDTQTLDERTGASASAPTMR